MHLVVVSMNHRTAPVDVRERFAVSPDRLPDALRELKRSKGILEGVILSTCNRTEIYAVVGRLDLCGSYVREFMERFYGVPASRFSGCLEMKEDREAGEHLFTVACGLDSMVVGETQILGQVKTAYFAAQREGAVGTLLNRLFRQAITVAKRAHAETKINDNAVSVAYAACELARSRLGTLRDRQVMMIGAGETGELVVRHMMSRGASSVTVANRTLSTAERLAGQFSGGQACRLDEAAGRLAGEDIDIVIACTGSPDYVLTREQVADILNRRGNKPLFMIDIAVPRNLDPSIAELDQAALFDIDDLQAVVAGNLAGRAKEAAKIRSMIETELEAYEEWYRRLGVGPVIRALQERAKTVHETTMDSLLRKLPELTEREIKVIRKLSKSIANQMLNDPINRIKEMAAGRSGKEALDMFVRLFALENALSAMDSADGANPETMPDEQPLAAVGAAPPQR